MIRQQHRHRFKNIKTRIIPARVHTYRTISGRPDIMLTLEDRLAFRERVHIGDRVRLRDVGFIASNFPSPEPKDGTIIGLYPNIVLVQTKAYKTAFSYDQLMLHDNVYLIEDDHSTMRRVN